MPPGDRRAAARLRPMDAQAWRTPLAWRIPLARRPPLARRTCRTLQKKRTDESGGNGMAAMPRGCWKRLDKRFWQGIDKEPDSGFGRSASPEGQTAFSGFSRIAASAINSGCGEQTTRPGRSSLLSHLRGGVSRPRACRCIGFAVNFQFWGTVWRGKRCRSQPVVNSSLEGQKWSLRTCASLAPINLRTRFSLEKHSSKARPREQERWDGYLAVDRCRTAVPGLSFSMPCSMVGHAVFLSGRIVAISSAPTDHPTKLGHEGHFWAVSSSTGHPRRAKTTSPCRQLDSCKDFGKVDFGGGGESRTPVRE